jgi:hypothetical protein
MPYLSAAQSYAFSMLASCVRYICVGLVSLWLNLLMACGPDLAWKASNWLTSLWYVRIRRQSGGKASTNGARSISFIANGTVAHEEEPADAEVVHQTQLVVGEGAPGIIDWDRTRGFGCRPWWPN